VVLAGGLHPGNVAEAIAAVRPWGVDVASGVETSPGLKSHDLLARFIGAAKESA
jgi:phosphoribosylanthranilate isomerase